MNTMLRSALVKSHIPSQRSCALDLDQTRQLSRSFAQRIRNICIGKSWWSLENNGRLFGNERHFVFETLQIQCAEHIEFVRAEPKDWCPRICTSRGVFRQRFKADRALNLLQGHSD
jgi:hypothetical protein